MNYEIFFTLITFIAIIVLMILIPSREWKQPNAGGLVDERSWERSPLRPEF